MNIYIELKKQNRFKYVINKIGSRTEDMLFSIFQSLPEKLIPVCIMNWMEQYTNKRITELQQQIIRNRWQKIELEKAVDNIHNKQQD